MGQTSSEAAVTRAQVPDGVEDHADAGGVHEGDLGQVHDHHALALLHQVEHAPAQAGRGERVDLAVGSHDVRGARPRARPAKSEVDRLPPSRQPISPLWRPGGLRARRNGVIRAPDPRRKRRAARRARCPSGGPVRAGREWSRSRPRPIGQRPSGKPNAVARRVRSVLGPRTRALATAAVVSGRLVAVVAQAEEPDEPGDQQADVEYAEADHEDPPLGGHRLDANA